MAKILTIGEPLAVLVKKPRSRKFREEFNCYIAGAELNVAFNLTRLGHSVDYVTKVGKDSWGEAIESYLKENGVGTEHIMKSDSKYTGYMKKDIVESGDPQTEYFRRGSAASTLSVQDISDIDIKKYDHLHMTGIFPSLSPNTQAAALYLMDDARKAGVTISFDPNIRPQLWESERQMVYVLNHLAAKSDIVLPGIGEGVTLTGLKDKDAIVDHYLKMGVKKVFVKTGAKGAYVATDKERTVVSGFPVARVVDTVGAGDAFASGAISALLDGLTPQEAASRGCAAGALQVMHPGDNGGVTSLKQLNSFMANPQAYRMSTRDIPR